MITQNNLLNLSRSETEDLFSLKREDQIRKCRGSLWAMCQTLMPGFYLNDRSYLRQICNALQKLFEGKLIREDGYPYNKFIINMPPQFGKSRTLQLFSMWCFGQILHTKIILASYNDIIAGSFSKYTRDGIDEIKNDNTTIIYRDIFPWVRLREGSKSYMQWALQGTFFSYLGTGIGGTVTGKGATIRIIDDPVKNAEVAYNDDALDKIWQWYTGTFLSRKSGRVIDIINMTRWNKKDLCGRLLASKRAKFWYVLKYEAKKGKGLLCPDILNDEEYTELSDPEVGMDKTIFRANYHQEPIDILGKLYTSFKTYTDIPKDDDGNCVFEKILCYIDTADEGRDYLCAIVVGSYLGEGYLLDVLYTKDGMEITEPETAAFLNRNHVTAVRIESNNGGRGFARNIKRILRDQVSSEAEEGIPDEERQWSLISIKWFHQSENKRARILSNCSFIMQHIYFPVNWSIKWPRFFEAIVGYQKEGKNSYDDAPDALTGVAEMIGKSQPKAVIFGI